MKLFLILISFCLLSLTVNAKAVKNCTYNLDKKSVELQWTGFKTTDKVGVSGTFKDISWSAVPAKSVSDLMKSVKFKIKTKSISSGSSIRDKRVYKHFFKLMKNGESISGYGISVDIKKKSAVIEVDMNQERTPAIFSYEQSKDMSFIMKGKIDVLKNYKMEKSFNSIAKLCAKLHTGSDGVAKTWSDVDLEIKGKLVKACI